MTCKHKYLPYEYKAHYEEDKLCCTFLITKICEKCGEISPIQPKQEN